MRFLKKERTNVGLQYYFRSSLALNLMVTNKETTHRVQNAFLSKLAVPGSLLFTKKTDGLACVKVVLSSTEQGVILYPIVPLSVDGQRGLKFDLREEATWSFSHITDPSDFLVQQLHVIPTALLKDKRMEDGRPFGMRLVVSDTKVYGAVRFCGLQGFPGWTCAGMQRFVQYCDIPCERMPKLAQDLLKLILTYLFPEFDDRH